MGSVAGGLSQAPVGAAAEQNHVAQMSNVPKVTRLAQQLGWALQLGTTVCLSRIIAQFRQID